MSDLIAGVLDAYGGARRWAELTQLRAEFSISGPFWTVKGWPGGLDRVTVEIDTRTQHVTLSPFTQPDLKSVFDTAPERLSLQRSDGTVVETRPRPREAFAGFSASTPWDRLHLAYFISYALWNYFTTPFLLTYPGVATREMSPWQENGQSWRRLEVDFPPSIATHSTPTVFYFDDEYRQRRMDYAPEVTGGSPAAHYVSGHQSFDGLLVPTRRRVHPRDPQTGSSDPSHLLIAVDVHTVELT